MGIRKYQRAATEFEGDAGFITGVALNEVSMARRSFLGRIARSSTALAVLGVGAEVWMQSVSRRSIISSAVAAGAPRDMQLHPFPSDDPFNMPLGVNAWYAPTSDPATANVRTRPGAMAVNNGWSHKIYLATTSDPLHTFVHERWGICPWMSCKAESYREDEHATIGFSEHLSSSATPSSQSDGHLHIMIGNELIEFFGFRRQTATTAKARRLVRNRLDHYAHSAGSNPLRNVAGTRAWGGSAVAGLVRRHEVDTANPHIPHALAVAMQWNQQLGQGLHGDPSSPLQGVRQMFPANAIDTHQYEPNEGRNDQNNVRMGMRFAMDPTVVTDTFLNNISNIYTRAIVRALRDYGMIVVDATSSNNTLYGEPGVLGHIESGMQAWAPYSTHLRRVAGAGPVHNPGESHWNTWRAGQGWGGGAPRVTYVSPLSPAVPPQAPGSIEITESRRIGNTG